MIEEKLLLFVQHFQTKEKFFFNLEENDFEPKNYISVLKICLIKKEKRFSTKRFSQKEFRNVSQCDPPNTASVSITEKMITLQDHMQEASVQDQLDRNRMKTGTLTRAGSNKEHGTTMPPRPPQRTSSSLSTVVGSTSGSVKKRVQIQEITV